MNIRGPHWSSTETKVLAEWIKADSKKRPLGAHVNCCDACYERNCPCCVYVVCVMLSVMSIVLFGIFCARIVTPYLYARKFEDAKCEAISSRFKPEMQCACWNKNSCHSTHDCLDINVTMTTPGGMTVNTTLYNDPRALENQRCTYIPKCVSSIYIIKFMINSFNRTYGARGTPYNCLYNRQSPREVIVALEERVVDGEVVAHVVVWPIIIVFLALLSMTITYFICGCRPYVCRSKPSPELREEAYRRDAKSLAALQRRDINAARREEEAYRKFYEMQGMPVPPPTTNSATENSLLHSPSELQAILDKA